MAAKNVFIEYYTIDNLASEEDEYEPDDIDLEDDYVEQGTRLAVVMKHRNKYYEFGMFHNTVESAIR